VFGKTQKVSKDGPNMKLFKNDYKNAMGPIKQRPRSLAQQKEFFPLPFSSEKRGISLFGFGQGEMML